MPPAKRERRFRPSSIDRWFVESCLGSTALIEAKKLKPRPSSREAAEGTVAHALMEAFFTGQITNTYDRLGWSMEVDGFKIEIDDEMCGSIDIIIGVVNARMTPGTAFLFEHNMTLEKWDPSNPLLAENGGTADILIFDYAARIIRVVDLKYGKGIPVDGDAKQLKNYGVLALINHPHPDGGQWEWVETCVVQPRMFSEEQRVKSFTHKVADLWLFANDIYRSMAMADSQDAPLRPSDKACKWCPAADNLSCPAQIAEAISIGQSMLTPIVNGVAVPYTATSPVPAIVMANEPPVVDNFTPEQLSILLKKRVAWSKFIQAAEQRAVQYLTSGISVPGFAITQRSGNRKISDPPTAVTKLAETGMPTTDMFKPMVLKSPAQLEAAAKGKPYARQVENLLKADAEGTLVERALGDVTLVQSDDDKPPPGRVSVEPIFDALPTASVR